MQFKVGDRVVLVNLISIYGGEYPALESNIIGNRGVITKVYNARSVGYSVRWDNGSSNGYHKGNLSYGEVVNV